MKKFLVSAFVILFGGMGLVFALPQTASAAACDNDGNFLSFPTWYRGLCDDAGELNNDMFKDRQVGPIVFTIALNIIDIALRVVAIVAVGFVIYGGFRYVISRGSPEETKKALDTILHAVIGMVIAMASALIVGFIVGRLNP